MVWRLPCQQCSLPPDKTAVMILLRSLFSFWRESMQLFSCCPLQDFHRLRLPHPIQMKKVNQCEEMKFAVEEEKNESGRTTHRYSSFLSLECLVMVVQDMKRENETIP